MMRWQKTRFGTFRVIRNHTNHFNESMILGRLEGYTIQTVANSFHIY